MQIDQGAIVLVKLTPVLVLFEQEGFMNAKNEAESFVSLYGQFVPESDG
jgi:hypothetical protein